MFKLDDFRMCFSGRIAPNGMKAVIISFGCAAVFALISSKLGLIGIFAALFVTYFFRDPDRIPANIAGSVVSPADGLVVEIGEEYPPDYVGLGKKKKYHKVSIFLSIFDVHVQRFPVSGTVIKKHYKSGKFLSVMDQGASATNEQLSIVIDGSAHKDTFICTQIAGLMARRIICEPIENDKLSAGDRYGLICFGSRLEIYIPIEYNIMVKKEQRMIAGETLIALRSDA